MSVIIELLHHAQQDTEWEGRPGSKARVRKERKKQGKLMSGPPRGLKDGKWKGKNVMRE